MTSSAEPILELRGVNKSFGVVHVLHDINFQVYPGEVTALVGDNGAGKSTTMRMVGTVTPRTGGDLSVLGREPNTDARAIKARLGVVPQEDTLDTELTVAQNLQVYGRYFGLSKAEINRRMGELLDFVQLADRKDARVEALSGGMKRRLTVARGLINDPELVLLDEPTTGLDPQARHVLWDRLAQLRERGVTLILTTHYMDEAEQLCDRLVIINEGVIIAEGSPQELIAEHVAKEVVELRFRGEQAVDGDRIRGVLDGRARNVDVVTDRALVATDVATEVQRAVEQSDLAPTGVLTRRATLEDVFLALTGRKLIE